MKHLKKLSLISLTLLLTLCYGCNNNDDMDIVMGANQRVFGVFTVQEDNTTVHMNGDIDSNIGNSFNQLRAAFPSAKRIVMLDVPGSSDDDANLAVSKQMHDLGYSFHLTSNSVIASGAVDMYVGGVSRTREAGSQIGVHSWGAGPGEPIATSYPQGHTVHLPYINYYVSVGFTQQEAEAFYYFTINAAPAEGIHWMTDAEIETYGVTAN
jgi:hypothetical protein